MDGKLKNRNQKNVPGSDLELMSSCYIRAIKHKMDGRIRDGKSHR